LIQQISHIINYSNYTNLYYFEAFILIIIFDAISMFLCFKLNDRFLCLFCQYVHFIIIFAYITLYKSGSVLFLEIDEKSEHVLDILSFCYLPISF